MPSVQLQWDVAQKLMAYAKWDKSYKSGGFNAGIFATAADINYDEEKVSGYEIGLKSTLADGAAVLNVALFDAKFKDLQVNTLTGAGQTLLSNAGAATTRGVELDGAWAVTRAFRVGGSASYLDAEYDDYARGPCSAIQRSAAVGTGVPCVQNLTGRTTSYAPRWSGDFFGAVEFPLSSGLNLRLHADASYTDDYFYSTDLDPNLHQSSFWKFGARVTVADAKGTWDVSLLGKNLTNKAVVVWGTGVPLVLGTYVGFTELPRTIALQANYRFRAR
jgi:outer membrane receptor protein involved in Fe transport